jgi:hypothetical protein
MGKKVMKKFIFVELHHILIHTRNIVFCHHPHYDKKRMLIHFQTMKPFNQELFFSNQIHSFIS